jgi:aspartyl/asparaginyl beta-hydroxylase (cupin superfamily)
MVIEKKISLKLKFIKYIIKKPIEWLNQIFSLKGYPAIFEKYQFKWVQELESAADDIISECRNVFQPETIPTVQSIFPAESPIALESNWRVYFLYLYWHIVQEHSARCPQTMAAIKHIPGVVSAFFSVLSPGKEIPEHVGGYNGVLRCHLGLVIPSKSECCALSVNKQIEYWSPKKVLIFDDTFPHSAWNQSQDEYRIVLFIDFLRPLPPVISHINKLFYRWLSKHEDIQEGFDNLKKAKLTLNKTYF